ncbi:MAG: serine/threonine protein kinase, partial [Akkermansiaceae bacterium]|nr:serine/threonine protein kinase [Akkermansiaceae bacterium]
MKVECPQCAQRIALDGEDLASLQGAAGFDCPACGGWVPLAPGTTEAGAVSEAAPGAPRHADWVAPSAADVSRSFDSRYRIQRLLGRGGMGAVYEGFDTRLDRRVAIKILPAGSGSDPGALLRFEREAKAMAALDHPNIVHIHDYGQTPDGNPYFVMEFIDGMDVHHLRHSGQLDLPGALELVSQVCAALQYAHSRGIVHRDIKPGNILVTREGVAKVADFGLAKVLGTEDQPRHDPTLTKSGTALGTPDYMAPEQFEGHHVDHRADIYALGVMLYDLLTGSPPRGAWPLPSERVQIDVRLDEIVLRALQQNPAARYQSSSALRADIDSVKSSTGGGPLPPGVDPAPLPSQTASSPFIQAAPATGGNSRAASPRAAVGPAPADELADASGGLTTTLLVLGLLAIVIVGGLALYLAKREPAETHDNRDTTENIKIHRDIPPGLNAEDLEGVGDIHANPSGYIGISMDALDWEQALALAKRTGAEVLAVDEADPAWASLHDWLRGKFPAPLALQVWVRKQGEPGLLDAEKIAAPESQGEKGREIRHKVLLHWRRSAPVSSAHPIEGVT